MFDAIKPKGVNLDILLSVNHKIATDRLLVKLLFFVMFARREGKDKLERFIPHLAPTSLPRGYPLP